MAPKKRSQTPRHSAITEPTSPLLSQQLTNTFLSDPSTTDRRHPATDSPRVIPSARQLPVPASRSPIAADSPHSPIDGPAPGSDSRRESTSTMRTSSISMEGNASCTPTGRVSKAKKGKRVHACEFPGCGKVFTRAEHRRRHELNHNPEALFPCTRPGCRKAFHRIDLLQRHQERHDLDSATDVPPGHMGQTSHISSAGALSIGSLVHPQTDYRYNMGTSAFNPFPQRSMHFVPGFTSDDSMFYTPESSQSPVSEYYGRYAHRQSISSSSSVAAFEPNGASPLIGGNMPGSWAPGSAPPSILPSNMLDEGSYLPSPADSAVPIPLSDLDGYEWSVIRRELSNTSGLLPGDAASGVSDTIRWDCLDYYWQHFHPHFPIVHRPSFLPTKPSPLLASAMAAIGSQYDSRPDAKQYSLTLLEVATKLLRRRDSITSRSRLADLQTVFLLEILAKFCSRRAEVEMSARFRSLFASLDQARRTLATDPLAVFRTLRKERTPEDVARAHKFWLDHETRRRILQASHVLDHQQVTLFAQAPTIVQHERPRRGGAPSLRCSIPLPCSEELWETSPVEAWSEKASNTQAPRLRSPQQQQTPRTPTDYFQAQVSLVSNPDLPIDQALPRELQAGTSGACLTFNCHVVEMARSTPIRQLLVVSGESWILGKKLENEAEFQEAKRTLRAWVDANHESSTAIWHATQVLRSRISFASADYTNTELSVSFHDTHMLHEPWAFYLAALVCWAYGFSTSTMVENSGQGSGAASVISEPQSILSRASSMSSAHPALLDAHEAAYSTREYLAATDVGTAEDMSRIDFQLLGRTHGLLEIIRLYKIGGLLGGLMNEADRVLFRLVEGRSRLSHF
ncbi:hypothetical protein, variant [Exophiala sideris]|uniref:C2H2-type domain-containing protein n=1 Tax=Exophiala sideris TaxID=1016849 RepID=A0A0D1Z8H6_9EURO|nr:hypothetical protein, variant [Exophiala sideris]